MMHCCHTLRSILAIILLLACQCKSNTETGDLYVFEPPELKSQFPDGIPASQALFGLPQYGSSVTGVLLLAPLYNNSRDGCGPNPANWTSGLVNDSDFLLGVERSPACSFTDKALYAQKLGAAGLVLFDNKNERLPTYLYPTQGYEEVRIPLMMISTQSATTIKATLAEPNTTVVLSMMWEIEQVQDGSVVEWDLWTSSTSPVGAQFEKTYAPLALALGDAVRFTPHYFVLPGWWFSCRRCILGYCYETGNCGKQCTNSGRYCLPDPEYDLSLGLEGRDAIFENTRRTCLWNYLNSTNTNATVQQEWWTYSLEFAARCNGTDHFNANCSQTLQREIGGDPLVEYIEECVNQSGGFTSGKNSLLDQTIREAGQSELRVVIPTVLVNGISYNGHFACEQNKHCGLLIHLCNSLSLNTVPPPICNFFRNGDCAVGQIKDACDVCGGNSTEVCKVVNNNGNNNDNDNNNDQGRTNNNGNNNTPSSNSSNDNSGSNLPTGVIIAICVGALVVIVGAYFVYRIVQRQSRENARLHSILSQYKPLDDVVPSDAAEYHKEGSIVPTMSLGVEELARPSSNEYIQAAPPV